ncbi:YybH family protein [Streptomyces sp. NPDC059524]|uniref:YybH family protein n=1 Tax=Streptomyces sp. NPDC059524 TaxID=3346856 RepID=UPI00367B0269
MTSIDMCTVDAGLPSEAAELPALFMAVFNAGDAQGLSRLYREDAVLVPDPGHPVTGEGLLAANGRFLGYGLPIDIRLRHTYVAGDTALLVADWKLCGVATDGETVDLGGTATDVAQRGADGRWRYVIDNPFGTR